jgi:membrane protease YdiL (CAAX protease family)
VTATPPAKQTWRIAGLELDRRVTVAIIISTLLLMLDYYNQVLPAGSFTGLVRAKAIERVFYYLLAPLLIIFRFRDRPADYGFQWGDWRRGLLLVGASALVAAPFLYLSARTPAMTAYYSQAEQAPLEVLIVAAVDLFGWEFFFRGFLLFTLARVAGPHAILLQAVPFAMAHLGKPQLETLSTIFGGSYFGYLAWRTRSFVYPFLLHWLVNVLVVLVAMASAAG